MLSKIVSKNGIESKSQQNMADGIPKCCCLKSCQRTELKANHNFMADDVFDVPLSKIVSKNGIESKSQLPKPGLFVSRRCLKSCQRTELKANHNVEELTRMAQIVV